MKAIIKRAVLLAAGAALLISSGCSDSTEVSLAKVPPVQITPPPPPKAGLPGIRSPDVLPGQ